MINLNQKGSVTRARAEMLCIPGETELTVAQYLDTWLIGRQRDLSASTASSYTQLLSYVTLAEGTLPLKELTARHIKAIYDSIIDSGRTHKTALNLHRVLRKALQDAIDIDEVLTANPAKPQIAPRARKFQPYVLERHDLERIFRVADKTPIGALARLAAWTGLRLGEILGLRWIDLDLVAGNLSVRQTITTSGRLAKPKTQRSARTIEISPATITLLLEVHKQQVDEKTRSRDAYDDAGYVFADSRGKPRSQSHVDWYWKRVRSLAGLPQARFHDLRHAHASHLLAGGFEVALVAERLGHSQTSTTLNIYSHALRPRNAAMVQAIDHLLA